MDQLCKTGKSMTQTMCNISIEGKSQKLPAAAMTMG